MRFLLRRWLANPRRLRSFESVVAAGRVHAEAALHPNAPIEIQEAIRAVNPAPPAYGAWTPNGAVWKGEVVVQGRRGVRQWSRTIVPIFDATKVIGRYIRIDIDISEHKEFERASVENARRQTLIAEVGRKALDEGGGRRRGKHRAGARVRAAGVSRASRAGLG